MRRGKPKVLVVEDDRKTSEIIRACLEQDGFSVDIAYDGPAGLRSALDNPPELVVLDLMLPVIDGLQLCRSLRSQGPVPIIVLTARTTEADRLRSLDMGADDYLPKPFSPRELMARIRAVLRRPRGDSLNMVPRSLGFQDMTLNADTRSVELGDYEKKLTPTEYKILEVMMREPGRLFTRSQLVEKALGYDYEGMERTIDVHVLNLRRKIESDPKNPSCIRTVYGGGYKLGP